MNFDKWFAENEMEEFKPIFVEQRFRDLKTVAEISSQEELEQIGITLLGDKLFVMRKLRSLKDALSNTTTNSEKSGTQGVNLNCLQQASKLLILLPLIGLDFFIFQLCFCIKALKKFFHWRPSIFVFCF